MEIVQLNALIMASLTLGIIACILIGKHKRSSLGSVDTIRDIACYEYSGFEETTLVYSVRFVKFSRHFFLQLLMASRIGKVIVYKSDQAMQKLGIS